MGVQSTRFPSDLDRARPGPASPAGRQAILDALETPSNGRMDARRSVSLDQRPRPYGPWPVDRACFRRRRSRLAAPTVPVPLGQGGHAQGVLAGHCRRAGDGTRWFDWVRCRVAHAATLQADYRFQNDLSDFNGVGPNLVDIGPGISSFITDDVDLSDRTVYRCPQGDKGAGRHVRSGHPERPVHRRRAVPVRHGHRLPRRSHVDRSAGPPVLSALSRQEPLVHQEPAERGVVGVEAPEHGVHLTLRVAHPHVELQGQP
jgi:hypothetical protein